MLLELMITPHDNISMILYKTIRTLTFIAVFFSSLSAIAQGITITGTVYSEEGPLAAVNVFVQGSTYGNITDMDGEYTLLIPNSNATLIFSYVGYKTVLEYVGNRTVIDVFMNADVAQLDEVVVTGYTTQAVKNISGAIDVVDTESMKTVPSSNVSEQLQGRASGLNVTNSGRPGAPPTVRIRGYGTINDNSPLYIVDGAPADQATIEMLNPYDIESAQVLKDASAASVYGARAANGVIIFTTKQGKKQNKTNITFDGFAGVQYATNFTELCNPTEVADILKISQENANMPLNHPQYVLSRDSAGNAVEWGLPDYIIPAGYSIAIQGPLDESDYNFESVDKAYTRASKEGTNWIDQVYQPGMIQNYNLTVASGNDKGQYAFTLGYFDQQGLIIHTDYKRLTLRINTLFKVKDWLRIGENLGISFHSQTGNPATTGYSIAHPEIMPVYDIAGNYTGDKAAGLYVDNPIAQLNRNQDNYNKYARLLGSLFIEIDFFKDLTFKSSFSPNLKFTFRDTFFDPAKYENLVPGVSQLSQRINNSINWTWFNTLTYSKTFSEKHNLVGLFGTEAIDDQTTWHTARISKFYTDDVSYRILDRGEEDPYVSGSYSEWSMFSIFARIDYNFMSKYIISGTIRRDGSSRFGTGNKYGIFPAFSAAWRISGENFMSNANFVNDLKIRAGWGQTGNQNIGNYRIKSSYGTSYETSAYSITGAQNEAEAGLQSETFGNPNTKWETTTTTNFGLDLAMFNNSLTFLFDWYIRETEDLLLEVRPSTLIGLALPPYQNIGKMKNTGIDFSLFYHSPSTKKFTWDIGVNFTHYKNEVTKLANPEDIFAGGFGTGDASTNVTMEGYPISSFLGLNILGIYQNEEDVINGPTYEFGDWINDSTWVPDPARGVGRWKFEDSNGNDSIDYNNPREDDRIILGSPHPDFTFGIPMNFRYKGFDLNLFWYGSYGNEIYNLNKRKTDFLWSWPDPNVQFSKRMLESWGMPGVDKSKAILPEVNAGIVNDDVLRLEYYPNISYYVEDGSYLRLSQLIIGYNFNTTGWRGIEKFRIYFQVDNVFTLTNYQGIDPSINRFESDWYEFTNDFNLGVDLGQYPIPRSFLLGINITL